MTATKRVSHLSLEVWCFDLIFPFLFATPSVSSTTFVVA